LYQLLEELLSTAQFAHITFEVLDGVNLVGNIDISQSWKIIQNTDLEELELLVWFEIGC